MSVFSHGSTPSTPHGAHRRRSEGGEDGKTELLLDEARFFTTSESPDSHRIIKKSRTDDSSAGSSIPTPNPPVRSTVPPPSQDAFVPPLISQEAHLPPTLASHLIQINALLTQALLLAIETVSPSAGHSEYLARSRQLVRTLAAHFDVGVYFY